tara:strand:- start:6444 stop:6728 length:285 start_codon:yes stop_codon:yes gene_type:complete
MSKVIRLNKENEETYIAILKDSKKVNIWCDKDIRCKISDIDFGKIINFSIEKLTVLKGYLMGEILVQHIDNPVVVRFCVDEEGGLNIDSIILIN